MKPLRKRHLQIWIMLAVLVPAGIISGYMVVPEEVINKSLPGEMTGALPIVVNKAETKNYSVYLRSSADKKNYQLQWINTKVSEQPSSLVYEERNGERELIGRVESTGTYFFPLKADPGNAYHFILYDIIHQHITDSINFK